VTSLIRIALVAAVAMLGLSGPAFAQQAASTKFPGSLLVFPKFIRGSTGANAATTFEIGVVCPDDINPGPCAAGPPQSATNRVIIHARWICPGPPGGTAAGFCQGQDFLLHTTVNGKLEFNAAGRLTVGPFDLNGGVIPVPQCNEGFLQVFVVNELDQPISFNGLIGEAVLRFTPGSASAYNAVAIQSDRGSDGLTFVNPANPLGPALTANDPLFFGQRVQYQTVAGQIAGDVRYEKLAAPTVRTFITLVALDVAPNRLNPAIQVPVSFYRANETGVSTTIGLTCYTQLRLTSINSNLTQAKMGTKGLIDSSGPAVVSDTFDGGPDVGLAVPVLGLVTTVEDGASPREITYALFSKGPPVSAGASEVSLIVFGILALGWLTLRRRQRTRVPRA